MKMALAMEEMRDRCRTTGFHGVMKVWRSFVPMVAEVSEKIISLSCQQSTQVPFLGSTSSAVEMMVVSAVLDQTRLTAFSPRTETDVEHTIASLRKSVAEKTQENQTLKAENLRNTREIQQLQYKLDLARGKIFLPPGEGGPSEK